MNSPGRSANRSRLFELLMLGRRCKVELRPKDRRMWRRATPQTSDGPGPLKGKSLFLIIGCGEWRAFGFHVMRRSFMAKIAKDVSKEYLQSMRDYGWIADRFTRNLTLCSVTDA